MVELSFIMRVLVRLPFAGLLLIVLWLPIPHGSNVPWAVSLLGIMTFACLALLALLLALNKLRLPPTMWDNRWILALWLGWLCLIMWQLTVFSSSTSIAPEVTYRHLLESLTYFGLYLLVLLTAAEQKRLRILGMVIVFSGLTQALYGSVMALSGLEYGFLVKKVHYLNNATGTFINRNHLAGYLEICAAVGVGLVVADMQSMSNRKWRVWLRDLTELAFTRKFLIRACVAIMVIGLVLTRSRMGNTAFFASLLICGLLYVLLRERRHLLKALMLFASFLVVDLLIVSEYFGLEEVVERIEKTEIEREGRAYITPELTKGVEAYWTTGSGLGTFSLAILPYRQVMPTQFLDHAHNDYAQFMIEVGLPGSLILLCIALVTAVHATRVMASRRNRLRTGIALSGIMALTALAIHSAVDFNLQIPANAATLVIVMAMVNCCSARSRRSSRNNNIAPDESLRDADVMAVPGQPSRVYLTR